MDSQSHGTKSTRKSKAVAVVPLKQLDHAKSRLNPVLHATDRERLVLAMLEDVLSELRRSEMIAKILLATREPISNVEIDISGVEIFSDSADKDLNSALHAATSYVMKHHDSKPLIAIPGDVPLITVSDIEGILSLGEEGQAPLVVAAPSENYGTSALLRNPPNAIEVQFGALSFMHHRNAAEKKGIPFLEYRSPTIALDIDTPRDLKALMLRKEDNATMRFLRQSDALQSNFMKSS